jgi:hypothetical protein
MSHKPFHGTFPLPEGVKNGEQEEDRLSLGEKSRKIEEDQLNY